MKTITLHRKGGRKPWVFEWCKDRVNYFHHTKWTTYVLKIRHDKIEIISFILKDFWGRELYRDVSKQIRADYFKLGNVTVTFD